jgi:hypothetical protein
MAASLISNVSCGDGGSDSAPDTTKPVINLIEPEDGDVLGIGESVHFEMELSDNDRLNEYKVEIHSNFDGHSHSALRADETPTVDFFFEHTWADISGKRNATVHHHEIVIPSDATPGAYHLEVFVTDMSGNEAFIVRNIELSHDAPEHDD